MANKLYENHTNMLQVVYDDSMEPYKVVPQGTVTLDEKSGDKYGCLREKKADESKKDDNSKKDDKKDVKV